MQTVDLVFGPPWPSCRTFEEAVAAADAQPEQVQAKRDSQLISGAIVSFGAFGESSCAIGFSNGWYLVAEACDFVTRWRVQQDAPPQIKPVAARVMRAPGGSDWNFDPNELLSEIDGAELWMLRVTNRNLLVYTRGNEILWLSAYQDRAGSNVLHAHFEG